MKVLLYPGISEGYGTGHVLRSYYLYDYLTKSSDVGDISLGSNDPVLAERVIRSIGGDVKVIEFKPFQKYDVIVYDYATIDKGLLTSLRNSCNRLFGLDVSSFPEEFDVLINLFTHNTAGINEFKGEFYEGLDFVIFKEALFNLRKPPFVQVEERDRKKVLISFGGEDPSSLTLSVLKKLSGLDMNHLDITVLLGLLNKDRARIINEYGENVTLSLPTPKIIEFMADSDLVICGGGTTMIEAIYVGNPVLALPQNQFEQRFIDFVRIKVPVFDMHNCEMLLRSLEDGELRSQIRNSYKELVDGKGRERIKELMLKGAGQ